MRHLGRPSGFSGHYSQGGRFSILLFVLLGVCLSTGAAEARRYDVAAGVEEPVHFADSQLRICIELHLGRADPTPTEMLVLTHLYAAGKDIGELTGLEHWRVDEVNETESWEFVQGTVWSFTTADFIVVDDFELYDDNADADRAIFQTWLDGYGFGSPFGGSYSEGNGTGSSVGYWKAPFTEQTIVHGGGHSMPLGYNNADIPWYSQTERAWVTPQDWTVNGADTLQVFFRGTATNGLGDLYLAIEDSAGQAAIERNPDPFAAQAIEWRQWSIPLADLAAEGVNVTAVRKMSIRVGNPDNPQPDGSGTIYLDDIRVVRSESVASADISPTRPAPD